MGVPDPINAGECVDLAPLGLLLAENTGVAGGDEGNSIDVNYCIKNTLSGGLNRGSYGKDLSVNMLD
jgi:hypothetical protein